MTVRPSAYPSIFFESVVITCLSCALQVLQEAFGADDGGLVGELAGDVHGLAVGIRVASPAHRIEAFERKAQRVDAQVAGGARGVALVLGQPLAAASGR